MQRLSEWLLASAAPLQQLRSGQSRSLHADVQNINHENAGVQQPPKLRSKRRETWSRAGHGPALRSAGRGRLGYKR